MNNHTIAERLREYANYHESQEMNVYRVRAFNGNGSSAYSNVASTRTRSR